MQPFARTTWDVQPLLANESGEEGQLVPIVNPARLADSVGQVRNTSASEVDQAISDARAFAGDGDRTTPGDRATMLETAAGLMEENLPELMAICATEAGKTVQDSVSANSRSS